jgi:hypothetical protein
LKTNTNYFIIQSMKITYWLTALTGAAFLGWAHSHTDELPIVFGFVLITGAVLGALAPRRFLLSWLIASAPVPMVETLVRYKAMQATWPTTEAQPLYALVAAVPALIGVAIGAGLRRMTIR